MLNASKNLMLALLPLALVGCEDSPTPSTDSAADASDFVVTIKADGIDIPSTIQLTSGEVRFTAENKGDKLCFLHFQKGSAGYGMDIAAKDTIDFSIELKPDRYKVNCDSPASSNYQDYFQFTDVPVVITD